MLEIIDLAKRYGPVVALDGATFTADPGRIVGFLGPNGAGKTTTMRCVFGLATPDRGEVRWKGARRSTATRACGSGTCPSSAACTRGCGSREQLSYFAQQHGMPGKAADAAAGRWLERMGLADRSRVEARGALARQPAARPARDGARPRSRAARPRRAVLRARPDRHRDDDRGPPRARRGRRRGRLLEPPARPRRGRLRGRRHHRPRPDRRGRRIDELKTASGRQHLEVEVVGSGGRMARRRDRTSPSSTATATGSSCWSTESVDLDALLARARAAGEVRRFAYQPPQAVRAVHGGRRRRRPTDEAAA